MVTCFTCLPDFLSKGLDVSAPSYTATFYLPFINIYQHSSSKLLPRWLSGNESAYQCRRHRFKPWIREIPWRRKRKPTPVFLPGQSQGQRSLAGYSPWDHKESDMTKRTSMYVHPQNFQFTSLYPLGTQNAPSQRCPCRSPQNSPLNMKYIMSHSWRDWADVIKVTDFEIKSAA